MRSAATGLFLALAAAIACASPAAAALPTSVCLGDPSAAGVEQRPGELLRFGVNPAGEAGALGPSVPVVPGSEAQDLEAVSQLRPPAGAPFVIRLNRFFWSLGEEGIARFERLARTYTSRGYEVEIQVRYHPAPEQSGKIGEWASFVREVVRRLGADPGVVALQITNEVNFTTSPDSSDGSYPGAKDALIQGVEAAADEADRNGYTQLTVGFNWFYRMDPSTEADFWGYLRDHGGPDFIAAVDWVGLDAYPGTFFPPVELLPGGYRDGMVNAMSSLRDCFMPIAGLPASIPIHVEENGAPTGPLRSEAAQKSDLEEMAGAVDDFRGTYNVTDYRWFDLRDHDSGSLNFQHHYGLMRDDYSPKPAFAAYRDFVARRTRPGAPTAVSAATPASTKAPRRARKRCKRKRHRARHRCRRRGRG